jgi:hypothetical protein
MVNFQPETHLSAVVERFGGIQNINLLGFRANRG